MKSMSYKRQTLGQDGMMSFTVTLIMILVITLIVVGFSETTRRSQREALDRQLSSQAFYAAESGINAAKGNIASFTQANPAASLPDKTSCKDDYDATKPGGDSGSVPTDLASGVGYTCVLVNAHPQDLVYPVNQQNSTVAFLNANGALQTLQFQWHKQDGMDDSNCSVANAYNFPAPTTPPIADSWTCGDGVIRVELMAAPSGSSLSNANLDNNTVTVYLTPMGGHSGTATLSAGQNTYVVSGSSCATVCTANLNVSSFNNSNYYVRMMSIYRDDSGVTLSGTLTAAAGGGAATFNSSQAILDVTGKAQDELRRVQVRVDLTPTADSDSIPQNALSSAGTICKQFSIFPSDTITPSTDTCS